MFLLLKKNRTLAEIERLHKEAMIKCSEKEREFEMLMNMPANPTSRNKNYYVDQYIEEKAAINK